MASTSNKRQKVSLALSLEPTNTSNDSASVDNASKASLSERLHNLWAQRGDFSEFDADKLRSKIERERKREAKGRPDGESEESSSLGERPRSNSKRDEFDFQIPQDLDSSTKGKEKEKDEDEGEENQDETETKTDSTKLKKHLTRDTITSNEMLNLRNEMIQHLEQAKYHVYFLSGLLSYVSNFTKPTTTTNNPQSKDNNQSNNSNKLSLPSRAASPSGSSVGRKNQSRNTGGGSVNDQSHYGSSNHNPTPAEELGLDPISIGLSLVMNESEAKKDNVEEDDGENEEEDFDEPRNIKHLTLEERIRENSLLVSKKRNSLVNSIDILRNGARSIHPSAFPDNDERGPNHQPSSNESNGDQIHSQQSNPENQRFEILRKLKSNGWGINPSPIQLPKNVQGMSLEIGTQAENIDQGIGSSGARDCLIGWGIPEALSHFRALSYAQIGSSSDLSDSKSTPSKSQLIFPKRQHRRLRVVFVVIGTELNGDREVSIEEKFGSLIQELDGLEDNAVSESGKQGKNGDVEMQDPTKSEEESEQKKEDVDLDSELKQAQKEMMDEELFNELVGQYRRIERKFGLDDDFFGINKEGIRTKQKEHSSFKPKTKLSINHLSILLNSLVELRFEMVPTDHSDASSSNQSKKKKKMTEITDIKSDNYSHSYIADLVKVYFEMELIRRYREKAGVSASKRTVKVSSDWKKKRNLDDERGTKESHSLQCFIVIVKYFTFVNQLEGLLSRLINEHNLSLQNLEGSQDQSSKPKSSEIELTWNPISTISNLGSWAERLMLGQFGEENQNGLIDIVNSLGGSASLWKGNKAVATLNFSSSLNLSLQLPRPFNPLKSPLSDSKKASKEVQNANNSVDDDQQAKSRGRENQIPIDGKGRIINGLNLKQLEMFLRKALMED